MRSYYFKIEKLETNAVTFAYIFLAGESGKTTPPVKEFHSIRFGDEARRRVAKKAFKWINKNGVYGSSRLS